MTVYLVERELKGITMDQLAAAQKRAIDTSDKFTEQVARYAISGRPSCPARTGRCVYSRRAAWLMSKTSTARRRSRSSGLSKHSI